MTVRVVSKIAMLLSMAIVVKANDIVITNQLDASVMIIDSKSRKVVTTIKGVGGTPAGIGWCGNNNFVVSSPDDQNISLINSKTQRVEKSWKIGSGPLGIDCHDATAVIADWYDNKAYKLDINSGDIVEFAVGEAPSGVLIDAENNRFFVANRDENSVWAIDLTTGEVLAEMTTGEAPFGLGLEKTRNLLFTVNVRSNDISVFDAQSYEAIKTIAVGDWAYCITFDSENNRGYVTNQDDDSVSVIDLDELREIQRYDVGIAPEGISFLSGELWVVNWGIGTVSVLDAADGTTITEITVGEGARSFGRFVRTD